MITTDRFSELAISFPGTVQQPHFERTAFKVEGKRIFASVDDNSQSSNIRLSPEEQHAFCQLNPDAIYPVANKYGLQGWTTFDLRILPENIIDAALYSAYNLTFSQK
ncbi:MmcQ/YjbR family DNA-binding protein [Saccharicrinis sp. FJH54]|uniref:MmcQ/YjbR family DNA-binding protein n=1 Tax=Saccharicrinis sp. FJH54 TaxID=3344665 RepID=UPI0035D3DE75